MKPKKMFGFELRRLHNLIRTVINKSRPITDKPPLTQLQAGIVGYLYHHQEQPVYQKNIEEEFRISRATATNTLQVMEKNGLIIRSCMDRDARLKRIVMTTSALQDHMLVEEHMKMMDQRMLEGLSSAEQEKLFYLLDKVYHNLECMSLEMDENEKGIDDEPSSDSLRIYHKQEEEDMKPC